MKEEKRYYSTNKEYNKRKKHFFLYKFIYWTIGSLIVPKFDIEYKRNIEGRNIYVANHSKAFGVLFAVRRFDKDIRIWADGDLCFYKKAPKYVNHMYFNDRWYTWPLSLLIAPLLVYLFRACEVIPVYRDARLITTYKKTIETLNEGKSILLFAENPTKYNKYINELNKGFVEVGRMINKRLKIDANFVPMYIAWTIRKTKVGNPITFDKNNDYRLEVDRITDYIKDEITSLAESLPDHKVINFL